MCVCMCVYVYVYVCVCVCMRMYVYVCVCVCIYTCIYIYIYIHIHLHIHIWVCMHVCTPAHDVRRSTSPPVFCLCICMYKRRFHSFSTIARSSSKHNASLGRLSSHHGIRNVCFWYDQKKKTTKKYLFLVKWSEHLSGCAFAQLCKLVQGSGENMRCGESRFVR